jgi:hypothetical protein
MRHGGGRNRPFSYRYREGYVDMKLIENPTAGRPLLFFSSLIILTMDKEMRILKSHKFTLNRDVANTAKYNKKGRCKHRRS